MKMYNSEVLQDPHYTFSVRTENIKNRILNLQQDLTRVKSNVAYAIIEEEIELLVDDYIERMQIIKHNKESEENLEGENT